MHTPDEAAPSGQEDLRDLMDLVSKHSGRWAICYVPPLPGGGDGEFLAYRKLPRSFVDLGAQRSITSKDPADLDRRICYQDMLVRGIAHITGQDPDEAVMADDLLRGIEALLAEHAR